MRPPIAPLHAAYGAVLLFAPRVLTQAFPGADARTIAFARILGARHLTEAAILSRHRSARWLAAGGAVDAAHAATMIGIAAWLPARRRSALANSAIAATLAGLALLDAVAARRP
jgi:hypothetical protein